MSKIKNENYITIQGFMVNELNLKGNELIIYACIYGFSQTENQLFTGSLQYLADWTNSTKQGVIKNLKSLVEKGYIVKKDKVVNGVKFCEYYATELNTVLNKVEQGIKQSLTPPVKQSLPNNIDLDKKEDIKDNIKDNKKKPFEIIMDELKVYDSDLRDAICDFIDMRKLIKAPMTDRALKQLINKLYSLSSKKEEQLEMLNNAIISNWKTIYPLKKENNYKGKYVREEVVPSWFNKKVETTPLTDEEQKEADDLINNFDNPNYFEERRSKLQERLKNKYAKNVSNS